MHFTILLAFFELSRTVISMCAAGILLFLVALWAARTDLAQARGLDKVVALEQFVVRRTLGSLRRPASLGRPRPHDHGARIHAVAIVLGIFLRLRPAGRVVEHCHKNSGALVRPAVRNRDVSFRGDDGYPGSSRQPQRQVCMDARPPRNAHSGAEPGFSRETPCANKVASKAAARWKQAHHHRPRAGRDRRYILSAFRILCTPQTFPESRSKN